MGEMEHCSVTDVGKLKDGSRQMKSYTFGDSQLLLNYSLRGAIILKVCTRLGVRGLGCLRGLGGGLPGRLERQWRNQHRGVSSESPSAATERRSGSPPHALPWLPQGTQRSRGLSTPYPPPTFLLGTPHLPTLLPSSTKRGLGNRVHAASVGDRESSPLPLP